MGELTTTYRIVLYVVLIVATMLALDFRESWRFRHVRAARKEVRR